MWKSTLAELLFPFAFGLFCGFFGSLFIEDIYQVDEGESNVAIQLALFLLIFSSSTSCFSTSTSFLINTIVTEKETKMRESLRIMSM